ncbi:MAG TPA: MFS transporter [Gammaproteobacteria bacterium]|nr:MFS transporter [Gammaproteobacteria bacterium]
MMSIAVGEAAGARSAPVWSLRRIVTAGVIGNVLEWYDFAVYGYFASTLGALFFPAEDPASQTLAAFATYAVGFLMRPVGAALFGHIGDRYGRARALVISIALMAIPTVLMGLLPTYASIGIAAPLAMVLLRMAQGLAVGGEFTSSMVFLAENSPQQRRGFFTSFSMFGATAGTMLGSAVVALLTSVMSANALTEWGWRAAFVSGIVVAAVGVAIRRGMFDTTNGTMEKAPLTRAFREHRWQVLRIGLLNCGTAVIYYTLFVYAATWVPQATSVPRATAIQVTTLSMVTFLVVLPLVATLSDRIGRKGLMIGGLAACLVLAYPLVRLMHTGDPVLLTVGQLAFAALLACSMAPIPATMCETFPHGVRVSAVSVGYGLAYALFGGTAPLVAAWLIKRTGNDLAFVGYVMAVVALSLAIAATMRERRGEPLR